MSKWNDWRLWLGAAQAALIALRLFGVTLPWWAVLLPTWIFAGFIAFAVGVFLWAMWRHGGLGG